MMYCFVCVIGRMRRSEMKMCLECDTCGFSEEPDELVVRYPRSHHHITTT